jgi:hypothetical protein
MISDFIKAAISSQLSAISFDVRLQAALVQPTTAKDKLDQLKIGSPRLKADG